MQLSCGMQLMRELKINIEQNVGQHSATVRPCPCYCLNQYTLSSERLLGDTKVTSFARSFNMEPEPASHATKHAGRLCT